VFNFQVTGQERAPKGRGLASSAEVREVIFLVKFFLIL